MADDQNDDINLDGDDVSVQGGAAKRGKLLNPFIIKLLSGIIAAIVITVWIIVIVALMQRCTTSGTGGAGMPQTESITPTKVEHLEYLTLEEPFRQRLKDGKMIQLEIKIGYKSRNKKVQQELSQIIPEIRDIIIKHLATLDTEFFNDSNALNRLEEDLIKQINRIVNNGKAERIFYQEYTLM